MKYSLFSLTFIASLVFGASASAQCVLDGAPTNTEECDDGNAGGDGCNDQCEIEADWSCARPLNFGDIVVSDFAGGNATWVIDANNLGAVQTENTQTPSLATWGLDAYIGTYSASIEVETDNDNDMIGLAFGFTDGDEANANARWLMLDWKQEDQGNVLEGMALSYVEGAPNNGASVGSHSMPNRECPVAGTTCVTELIRAQNLGSTGWGDNTAHDFSVLYRPDKLIVVVDGQIEFDVRPSDFPGSVFPNNEFPPGGFAAYQISQDQTHVISAVNLGASQCNITMANDATNTVDLDFGSTTIDAGALFADNDDDLQPGSVSVISSPMGGTVTVNGNDITFTPDDDSVPGIYTIEYQICDDHPVAFDCDTGTITIVVSSGDTDGDGIDDDDDLDDDNDGIPDSEEGDGAVDTDGDGIPDSADLDSDNDGILDVVEAGHDGEDADGDGQLDCADVGANGLCDAFETAPDSGLSDYDGDGTEDTAVDTDNDGVPDFRDLDSDNDGVFDVEEGGAPCVQVDGECEGPDSDGDGIVDTLDVGAPGFGDTDGYDAPSDSDADGIPDFQSLDSDGDGIFDAIEGPATCVVNDSGLCGGDDADGDGVVDDAVPSPVVDTDGDGISDYQDRDSDNDGILDSVELTFDTDGDGILDYLDLDSDNDGIADVIEGGSGCADVAVADSICDGPDADGDGVVDDADVDAGTPDTDGDGVLDFRDLDSDNDGIVDLFEGVSGCIG